MPPGGPSSSRGRGGKFKKYTRGGGHSFSRNLQPIDSEGNQVSMWSGNAKGKGGDDDDDDDDEDEDSSSEDSDDAGDSKAGPSREDRKAQKKARKEAALAKQKGLNVEVGDMPSSDDDDDSDEDDDMPANPNHSKAARQQAAAPVVVEEEAGGVDEITDGVKKLKAPGNRRERESMEAAAAKEKYMRLHAQGKTDEAKADLARLRVIREQRAAEAARKQAEKEEKDEQEKSRRSEVEAREAKKREAAAGPKKTVKKK